jgi:hypothetical protein
MKFKRFFLGVPFDTASPVTPSGSFPSITEETIFKVKLAILLQSDGIG